MTAKKKQDEQVQELTADLQRIRADFENYRKRVETEKDQARASGKVHAIMKLLPIIDDIERATLHMPAELKDNTWANGVAALAKKLEKQLEGLGVKRIDANPGTVFDPEKHEAVQFDEASEGEHEIIAEELQAGYTLEGDVMRPSMVKVTR